jgi:hypothetical protein
MQLPRYGAFDPVSGVKNAYLAPAVGSFQEERQQNVYADFGVVMNS